MKKFLNEALTGWLGAFLRGEKKKGLIVLAVNILLIISVFIVIRVVSEAAFADTFIGRGEQPNFLYIPDTLWEKVNRWGPRSGWTGEYSLSSDNDPRVFHLFDWIASTHYNDFNADYQVFRLLSRSYYLSLSATIYAFLSSFVALFQVKKKKDLKRNEIRMNEWTQKYKTENTTSPSCQKEKLDVLRELKELEKDGIITFEEFELKKKEILDSQES